MASKQGSPVRDKAEWLLRFAVMSLATPRDFRRLRLEAHRWLDPDGARPLEWGELRDVQAHIQGGLKALRRPAHQAAVPAAGLADLSGLRLRVLP